ncbi:MAG: hypothetical protein K2O63_07050 [Alistipes sp.]|nr:hypothetical protein [Alistipes sp.]
MDEDIISGLLTMVALLIGLSGSIASAWAKRRGRKSVGPVADASEEPAVIGPEKRKFQPPVRQMKKRVPPSSAGKSARGVAAPSSKPSAAMSVERPEGNTLAEEFDLRRAVIYSEILRPKFKEEDNF